MPDQRQLCLVSSKVHKYCIYVYYNDNLTQKKTFKSQ